MEKKREFVFSVVIPVYNVEKYLAETLDSVIGQTIGFEENIQIILVNDGSPDNSEKICKKYQEKYPDNIVYVKKENGGVSSARNEGIPYIKGKYVNFLDSDDCWEKDAFAYIKEFFDEHYDETDVVAARKKFFGARNSFHRLDYRFKETKLVDLFVNYEFIQMDVTGSFIKADAIGGHRFSTKLKYGEDAQFVNSIILDKCTLGVVREAVHLYRKRVEETSALQNELQSESYFADSTKYFLRDMYEQSKKRYGRVIEYIQYMVMYDIQWRIQKPVKSVLSEEVYEEYRNSLVGLLSEISDIVILQHKIMFVNMKMYALSLKHGKDVRYDLSFDHNRMLYNNFSVMNFQSAKTLAIFYFMEIKDNVLYLDGKDNCALPEEFYDYYIISGGKTYRPEYYDCPMFDEVGIDGVIYKGRGLKFEIPIGDEHSENHLELFLKVKEYTNNISFGFGKFSHVPDVEGGYRVLGKRIITTTEKTLDVVPYKASLKDKLERKYRRTLITMNKGYLIKWRVMHNALYPFFKKNKLWLISDRVNKANDNGEHLFRYICTHKHKGIKPRYYINRSSEDYGKMKKIGKVIPYGTILYRVMFLLADKIISSSGNEYVINAFENDRRFMTDLYKFDYVFLQHGVTKDDLSDWVCRYNKDIKALVTAGRPEYESFCAPSYHYTPDIPILSGFPRHDNLMRMQKAAGENGPEKKILIIPTWRKTIKGSFNPETGESIYFNGFKDTDYFRFYNDLISNEKLCECMKKHGYTGLFCMHPSHAKQYVDFTPNDVFTVNHGYVDYQKEFTSSSLLVTDFSSVFFDFAYLKKPIVYSQFDRDTFFAGEHAYKKGYFSYENNGFGPVCTDLDSTVDAICKYVENDCKNSDMYIKRIEEFYPYFDENSCERVFNYIKKIDEKK